MCCYLWVLFSFQLEVQYASSGSLVTPMFVGGAWRGDVRPDGRQLGIARREADIRWMGRPGMLWGRVMVEVERFVRLNRPPDVLVIHAGGNDLGIWPVRDLLADIKRD